MTRLVVGLNHRTAPLGLREQLAISPYELPAALLSLRTGFDVDEAVILSTCNRIELYVVPSRTPAMTCQSLLDFMAYRSQLAPEAFRSRLYRLADEEAVKHLFRVTAGLDSMILGESEIAAQVKAAYCSAQAQGTVGPTLHRVFQKALHAAKVVRTETAVGRGETSIGSVVVALAKKRFGERLSSCGVLLWGAGQAAEAVAKHLLRAGIGQFWVVSRTPTRSQQFARLCQGGWLSWEQAQRHLAHIDLAIVCTQAPHYVISRDDLASVLPQRGGRPLLLIDLAVPRNIDPAIRAIPTVRLYDIDGLQAVAQANMAVRRQELLRCEAIIREQVDYLLRRQGASETTFSRQADGHALRSRQG